MPVEAIQCPRCGGPLFVDGATRETQCAFCGNHLRVTRGGSGQPRAILEDIGANTSLLAKQRALEHLIKYRDELLAERQGRCDQRQQLMPKIARVQADDLARRKQGQIVMLSTLSAIMVILSLCGIIGGGSVGIAILVFCIGLGALAIIRARSAAKERARLVKKAAEEKEAARATVAECEARLNAIDAELDEVRPRIGELERVITRLSMEV